MRCSIPLLRPNAPGAIGSKAGWSMARLRDGVGALRGGGGTATVATLVSRHHHHRHRLAAAHQADLDASAAAGRDPFSFMPSSSTPRPTAPTPTMPSSLAASAATTPDAVPGQSSSLLRSLALALSRRRVRARVDAALSAIERPATDLWAFSRESLVITATLAVATVQLAGEAYRTRVHFRLRRLLRFSIGTPFLFGIVYLLVMRHYYFPEPTGGGLDTSSVDGLPLCTTVEELLRLTRDVRQEYRWLQRRHAALAAMRRSKSWEALVAAAAASADLDTDSGVAVAVAVDASTAPATATATATVSTGGSAAPQGRGPVQAPDTELTPEERNATLRGLFVIIRSLQTELVGTSEERALIVPRTDLVAAASSPSPSPSSSAGGRPVSPAEFVLRVVLSIALEQGWFDVVEATRTLYKDLVRSSPVPVQAGVVVAVGDLCSLSYELESFNSRSRLTVDQRRRVARAIDTFRPERAVEERSTIASEISVLPLPDGDRTTRCLSMIRHSPGRKPQLVICFVGSNSRRNWFTNFNFLPVPLPPEFGVGGDVRVHRGFLDMLRSVKFAEMAEGFDEILLVGHSLGGALCQLAGLQLAAERPARRVTVITMASPRVIGVGPRGRLLRRGVGGGETVTGVVGDSTEKGGGGTAVGPPASSSPSSSLPPLMMPLVMPRNYRHFRGYVRADIVPKVPPEFIWRYQHSGNRLPLNTGCGSGGSFMAWGVWSFFFHKADFYARLLRNPPIAQTHFYTPTVEEALEQTARREERARARAEADELDGGGGDDYYGDGAGGVEPVGYRPTRLRSAFAPA